MTELSNQGEQELLQLIAGGDEQAFAVIYRRYVPKLNAFLSRTVKDPIQAREIVQEAFLELWISRASLANVTHPSAYIHRSVANKASKHFKQLQKDREIMFMITDENEPAAEQNPFLDLSAKQLGEEITRCIQELHPKRKEIFIMAREQGLSRREIAEKLGISENTVRNHIADAVSVLQEKLRNRTGILVPAIIIFSAW